MPVYTFADYETLVCPKCGFDHGAGLVTFQWGHCYGRMNPTRKYEIGDEIFWQADDDGEIRFDHYLEDGTLNAGESKYENLIVLDVATDTSVVPLSCKSCKSPFGGVAIEIKNGAIFDIFAFPIDRLPDGTEVVYWEFKEGENRKIKLLDPKEAEPWQAVEFYVLNDQGEYEPRLDWATGEKGVTVDQFK